MSEAALWFTGWILAGFVGPFVAGWFLTRRIGRWPGAIVVGVVFGTAIGLYVDNAEVGGIFGLIAFLLAMFSHAGFAIAGAYASFEGFRRRH